MQVLGNTFRLTTCEEMVKACESHEPYAEVIGKFISHDGNAVWLELAGCGASDSHAFTHKNTCPEYVTKMHEGKIVRLLGARAWDYRAEMWGYRWTLHAIAAEDNAVMGASKEMLAMCGTNC